MGIENGIYASRYVGNELRYRVLQRLNVEFCSCVSLSGQHVGSILQFLGEGVEVFTVDFGGAPYGL
jgi:hypothetical protein